MKSLLTGVAGFITMIVMNNVNELLIVIWGFMTLSSIWIEKSLKILYENQKNFSNKR